jgi:hypothetical protein
MKKRSVLSLLILICSLNLNAQKDTTFKRNIQLRGKISSFFIVEDIFFRNANIGLEYRFAQKHSIGIDYVFFRFRYENDSVVNGIEYGGGYSSYSRRDYLIVDYRYYPFQTINSKKGFDIYFNPFIKVGKRKIWDDTPAAYITEHNFEGIYNQQANFIDQGFAIGYKSSNLGKKNRWFFDMNIGVVYRSSYIKYEDGYDYMTNLPYTHANYTSTSWQPHMRINFCYKIIQF